MFVDTGTTPPTLQPHAAAKPAAAPKVAKPVDDAAGHAVTRGELLLIGGGVLLLLLLTGAFGGARQEA